MSVGDTDEGPTEPSFDATAPIVGSTAESTGMATEMVHRVMRAYWGGPADGLLAPSAPSTRTGQDRKTAANARHRALKALQRGAAMAAQVTPEDLKPEEPKE